MPDKKYLGEDGGRYASYYDKEAANNRYRQQQKQNELLKKQNELIEKQVNENSKLEQQRIQAERENSERIAQATLQAEREKAEINARAIRQAEQDRFRNQVYLQNMQHNFEEEQRKLRLCDNLGIDYEDIKQFDNYLHLGDGEKNIRIDKLNNMISYKEKALKDYRNNKPSEKSIRNKYNKKIYYIQDKIKNTKEENIFSLQGIYLGCIDFFIALSIFIAFDVGDDTGIDNLGLKILVGAIIFNIIWIMTVKLSRQSKIKAKIKPLEKELNDIKANQELAISAYKENAKKILEDYNNKVSNCKNEMENFKKEKQDLEDEIKQNQLDRYNDFVEFRTTHYNEEMEMLLKKLDFNYLKIMDSMFEEQNGELEECATKNGTVKDYIKYIKSKMKKQI